MHMNQKQQRLLTHAIGMLKEDRREDAANLLVPLQKQLPDNPQVWAVSAQAAGNIKERKQGLQQVLRLRPNDEWATRQLAELEAQMPATSSLSLSKRQKMWLGAMILLLGAVGLGLWALSRNGGDTASNETAISLTAQNWTVALAERRYNELSELTCQEKLEDGEIASLVEPIANQFNLVEGAPVSSLLTYSPQEIDGKDATILLTGMIESLGEINPNGSAVYQMKKEDGEWKWCGIEPLDP